MDSVTVVEEFLRLLAKGEAQRALALVSDDVVVIEPDGLVYGGEYRGKKAFVGVLKAIAENYLVELSQVRVVDGGDVFVAIADVRWTSVATSRALDTRFCELYTVDDGLITGIEVFPKDTRALHELTV